MAESPLFFI
ncbi:hypothetical protein RDI58_004614 [Solanum bulbocastanum]|uniref:Uncharacterized protein n=1 Tax=Solanum bulbocastanum TaxID=147425 RepID=A0AAN8U689_SOLBU